MGANTAKYDIWYFFSNNVSVVAVCPTCLMSLMYHFGFVDQCERATRPVRLQEATIKSVMWALAGKDFSVKHHLM